jgi:hypothetical protein
MQRPFLEYPDNFSTLYQSSDFDFPHDTILNLSYNELVKLFVDKNYIIPYYIKLYNPKINEKNINEILSILKNNENFLLLGTLFMYLKGLLENTDENTNISGINIIEDADKNITYKPKDLQNFVDNFAMYFKYNTVHDFVLMLNLIIDVTQNIIINVVNYVTQNYNFPEWFNNKVITDFIDYIPTLFTKKMKYYKGLNKTYSRYIGEIIHPLLNLFEKAEIFQYYS